MSDSKLGFAGKVAVVTGAGAGAGRASALLLAEMGAKVVPVDIVVEIAEDAAAEIRAAGGEAMGASADVTDEAAVQRLFDQTLDRFGRVDTLINNVGNMRGHAPTPIVDMGWEFWEVSVAQNLKSTFLCSQAAARAMIAGRTKGAIVNIASLSGLRASVRLAPYGAAKAGVMQFTKTLAVELAPHGIQGQLRRSRLDQRAAGEDPPSPVADGRDGEVDTAGAAQRAGGYRGDCRGPGLRPGLVRDRPDRDV